MSAFSLHLIELYSHYKKGVLPFVGGIYSQPAIYGQMMNIIDSRVNNAD